MRPLLTIAWAVTTAALWFFVVLAFLPMLAAAGMAALQKFWTKKMGQSE